MLPGMNQFSYEEGLAKLGLEGRFRADMSGAFFTQSVTYLEST